MELRQLEYFVAVSDCRNFTRAAEKVFVSQPAITMAINSQESELNLKLFVRSRRSVELTNEGKVFYNYVKNVLHQVDNTRTQIEFLREKKNGLVKVAVSPVVCSHRFLPSWFAFNDSQERITVAYTECERERALALLEDGKVDFAIVTGKEENYPANAILLQKGWLRLVSRRPIQSRSLDELHASSLIVLQDSEEDALPDYIGHDRILVQRLFLHDWNSVIFGDTTALLPDWLYPGKDFYYSSMDPAIECSVIVVFKKNTPSLECLMFLNHLVMNGTDEQYYGGML